MVLDGTAIGLGSLNGGYHRLKDSQAKSKVVILLTDGVNNGRWLAHAAGDCGRLVSRVYTIGIGTYGFAPYPVQTPFGIQYQNLEVQIDEDVMKQIAQMTKTASISVPPATRNSKKFIRKLTNWKNENPSLRSSRRYSKNFFPLPLQPQSCFFVEFALRENGIAEYSIELRGSDAS